MWGYIDVIGNINCSRSLYYHRGVGSRCFVVYKSIAGLFLFKLMVEYD
nr:MAG TPA: hypothetical protein [Caudoviricetes sp.]